MRKETLQIINFALLISLIITRKKGEKNPTKQYRENDRN